MTVMYVPYYGIVSLDALEFLPHFQQRMCDYSYFDSSF